MVAKRATVVYRPRMSATKHFNLKTGPGKGDGLRPGADLTKFRDHYDDIFRKKDQSSAAEESGSPSSSDVKSASAGM